MLCLFLSSSTTSKLEGQVERHTSEDLTDRGGKHVKKIQSVTCSGAKFPVFVGQVGCKEVYYRVTQLMKDLVERERECGCARASLMMVYEVPAQRICSRILHPWEVKPL